MDNLLPVAAVLALLAWAEGTLVIAMPNLTGPEVHRGVDGPTR